MQLTGPIDTAFKILFDYDGWPDDSQEATTLFEPHLQALGKHFEVIFKQHCGSAFGFKLESEWATVVRLMRDQPTRLTYRERWGKVATSKELGNAAKLLIEIEIAIVRDTSACERWFSLMNRLKDKRRNRLNTELLDDMMFICLHASRRMETLKAMCPAILEIWSESTDRYKKMD